MTVVSVLLGAAVEVGVGSKPRPSPSKSTSLFSLSYIYIYREKWDKYQTKIFPVALDPTNGFKMIEISIW